MNRLAALGLILLLAARPYNLSAQCPDGTPPPCVRPARQAVQDPATLGRALRAAYLVTGSVQRAGDRVRLRYEVIRAATRTHVAGDVIDRASSDLLTVESDIARQVASAITGRLLPEERARLTRRLTMSMY